MFDTMTITKIVAAICAPLLVFLLGSWAVESIYHVGAEGKGDAGTQAYLIDTGAASAPADAAAAGPDFATLLASADPAKGEKVFSKCKACHSLEAGKNKVGPSLYGVVGRGVDTEPGYAYSGKIEAVAKVWTPENLNKFLENPKKFAPGTKMGFAGLKKAKDRINLIAYLQTIKG